MATLTASGRGWINLMPESVERTALSATTSIPGMAFGRLSGRGAPAPKITWTAPELRRRRIEPSHLGIEHPGGPKAREQLAAAGHPVPAGWRVAQDHAIRGLVVVPNAVTADGSPDHATIIRWALDAAHLLTPTELGPVWQAQVFTET
jgi:hypothetical protein